MRKLKFHLLFGVLIYFAIPQSYADEFSSSPRILRTASGGKIKTLDPIYADDLASRDLCGAIYDTLLQYDYTARPYKLQPSMLESMPIINANCDTYRFKLRSDLHFQTLRPVVAQDVLNTLLRFADTRNHSPLYWLIRGKLLGLEEFRNKTRNAPAGDYSMYKEFPGFIIHNNREFSLKLTKSDPRFLYRLAIANMGIVPLEVVKAQGINFGRNPIGSGPFILKEWISDCRIVLERNPQFRREYFPQADDPSDRMRPLPLLDKIEILPIKQPMTAWLMFLQGNLDISALDKDNLDIIGDGQQLPKALKERGITLLKIPEFEIRYVGFNFSDPLLGNNLYLRQALSQAYNISRRVQHASGLLQVAHTPLPPGVAGFDPNFFNPLTKYDLDEAKRLLAKAGFPGGIDPATGKPLHLYFDQSGETATHRQIGELAADDFAKLGIHVESVLNHKPRFYDKLRRGRVQMFRLSWIGDYPDAENFLQLFYSGNKGGCNRTGFSDPKFDRHFEELLSMAESKERTEKYRYLSQYVTTLAPWIFEGFPISCQLKHRWLQNFIPHDFGFGRWKYLSIDNHCRQRLKSKFKPLSFNQLRH